MAKSLKEVTCEKIREQIEEHLRRIRLFKAEGYGITDRLLECRRLQGEIACDKSDELLNDDRVFDEVINEIVLKHEKTAAAVFFVLKNHHSSVESKFPFIKDVVGVLPSLGYVETESLSRMLYQFLGMDSMLAIVCKTMKCALHFVENYHPEETDIFKVAKAIGMERIENRIHTIFLEDLLPFPGDFVEGDPQKKLNLPLPKLPDGSVPCGFIGFAVNLINLETKHLTLVTSQGYGLRETLFYSLLSQVQVYERKEDMLEARSCITHGAFSLDGGIIEKPGIYVIRKKENTTLKFPVVMEQRKSQTSLEFDALEEEAKKLYWDLENYEFDIKREEYLLEKQRRLLEEEEAKG